MVSKRSLPERRNPLVEPENSPSHEILVERRRLGQTNLAVKPGQTGLVNASKIENLGSFDYAHLRAPLPKDLSGSGIFSLSKTSSYPESYFLMRRSSDGYISATGMFKAAFPWASVAEEEAERKYQKTFPSADSEEVAGSVWVAPEDALKLADEYGMRGWIVALLDAEPIEKGSKDRNNIEIMTPPRFIIPEKGSLLPPSASVRATRSRTSRSVSPSKVATPGRKIASPRKSRTTRNSVKTEPSTALGTIAATSPLQNVMENGTQGSESAVSESVDGETVRIEVDEAVEKNGDVETTTTTVKVDIPAEHPELPLLESTEDLIAKAKEMVEEANKLEGPKVNGVKSSKRKAEELEVDEEETVAEAQPVKKVKVLEEEIKKEKVTRKALIGLTAMVAIGATIPYFF
ncbi:uncharacterized protein K441DRAFT_691421 [Cenococcum geophilum 1.58]|uniref:Uncharacterized protein n=1 Tax=Cenococcum geophilum 1.58 TaxID=794803 RepID=A0ACC8EKV8_9PEZI|nr:hypothetical protein K441DRAFT_691421 [Cenococcum geophilum 1.58]